MTCKSSVCPVCSSWMGIVKYQRNNSYIFHPFGLYHYNLPNGEEPNTHWCSHLSQKRKLETLSKNDSFYFEFFVSTKGKGIKRLFEGSKMLSTFVCTRDYSPVIGKDKNWPEPKFDETIPKTVEIWMHGVLSSIPHSLSRSNIYEKNNFKFTHLLCGHFRIV